jgi:DNA-binding transcriptional regulator LsrR (DeoR family)
MKLLRRRAVSRDTKDDISYELARFKRELVTAAEWHMHDQDVRRADIAFTMGMSVPQFQRSLYDGDPLTVVAIAAALGLRFELTLTSKQPRT